MARLFRLLGDLEAPKIKIEMVKQLRIATRPFVGESFSEFFVYAKFFTSVLRVSGHMCVWVSSQTVFGHRGIVCKSCNSHQEIVTETCSIQFNSPPCILPRHAFSVVALWRAINLGNNASPRCFFAFESR